MKSNKFTKEQSSLGSQTRSNLCTVLMIVLAFGMVSCTSPYLENQKTRMLENIGREQAVQEKYRQKLASDPELTIIRGKSGITFDGCQTDHFDNNYPTNEEREAIKKFGRLMAAYFDEMYESQALSGNIAMLQRTRAQMMQDLASTRALYEGKLTWTQFGVMCEQIIENRRNTEIAIDQRRWDNFNKQQEEIRKERQDERRHQETMEAIRQSGQKQGSSSPSPSSTTCYPGPGGQVTCHHN